MQLKEDEHGRLYIVGKYGPESDIHLVHCNETLAEIKEDVARAYVVAEEATNWPRLHLVTDFSEDEALQQVGQYLREVEGLEEPHIIDVIKLEY